VAEIGCDDGGDKGCHDEQRRVLIREAQTTQEPPTARAGPQGRRGSAARLKSFTAGILEEDSSRNHEPSAQGAVQSEDLHARARAPSASRFRQAFADRSRLSATMVANIAAKEKGGGQWKGRGVRQGAPTWVWGRGR